MSGRKRPNILITGTPGTGKTSTASLVAERMGLKHINVGELIQQHKCYEGRDDDLDTNILDEDKLLDLLEPMFDDEDNDGGGIVADFHVCEIFPERWFDLVLVLRTSTNVLYDRLTKRGYSDHKRNQNMQSEIMQVILEEAVEAYDQNIVQEVQSNTLDDMESTMARVQLWTKQWLEDQSVNQQNNEDE